MVATDGRQLLVQGGFTFPWDGDVLVRRSPVFACKGLPRDRPVAVGKTDAHVALRVGPWTLYLEVQDARFPRVDQAIPDAGATATRLRLDPGDARVPARRPRPAARGRRAEQPGDPRPQRPDRRPGPGRRTRTQATELVLAHSSYTGAPVRVNANREFLARAVRLGFDRGRDRRRRLARGPPRPPPRVLLPAAVEGVGDRAGRRRHPDRVRRPHPDRGPPDPDGPHESEADRERHVRPRSSRPRRATAAAAVRDAAGVPAPGGLAALIREAESLHEALSDARAAPAVWSWRCASRSARAPRAEHPGVAPPAQAPGRRRVADTSRLAVPTDLPPEP